MVRIVPNPEAEASVAFEVVAPGVYRMRAEGSENLQAITPFTSKAGNECLRVRAVYADPSALLKLDGSPVRNAGSILDSSLVTSPADKQGKLRSFVESCGKQWDAIEDTDELIGLEFTAQVGIETYNGEERNVIKRYLPPTV